jgi:hypothetical protein
MIYTHTMLKRLTVKFGRWFAPEPLHLAPFFSYFTPDTLFARGGPRYQSFDSIRSKLEPELLRCLEPYEILSTKQLALLGHNDAMWHFGAYQRALNLPEQSFIRAAADQGHLQAKIDVAGALARRASRGENADLVKLTDEIVEGSPKRITEMIDLLLTSMDFVSAQKLIERYSHIPEVQARPL